MILLHGYIWNGGGKINGGNKGMKKRLMLSLVILLEIGFLKVSFSNAITVEEIEEMSVDEIIGLLNSPDTNTQSLALDYGVLRFLDDDRIRVAIIKLLQRENELKEQWWAEWDKECKRRGEEPPLEWDPEGIKEKRVTTGEGYLMLVDIVVDLKDERAISALVGGVQCGYDPIQAVVEFGEMAVKPLIERLKKTKNPSARSSIIYTLGEIAKRSKITSPPIEGTPTTKALFKALTVSQMELVKNAFIKSLNDSNPFTRMEAIRGVEIIGDTSAIPLLKQIVENDLCKWGTVDPVTKAPKKGYYPVREEAQRVLKLLEEKKKQEDEQKGETDKK